MKICQLEFVARYIPLTNCTPNANLKRWSTMKEKTIYALGFFDGVHLGHAALLQQCRAMADEMGCKAGVVTFENHPDGLVFGAVPCLINTSIDRERLLRGLYGMDHVICLPFDKAMMTMPWQDFFRLLVEKYGAAGLVCGYDFRFGNRGEGTAALLQAACRETGIPCAVVPEQSIDGVTVSSTHIRSLVEGGQMEQAVKFLGHPHILTGEVVPGRQLGRTIGIPTANLHLPEGVLIPMFGVYCCRAIADGTAYPAVTNVGTRPTVGGHHVTVEPWLLGFEGDLYGRVITLEFYKFLRPEKKFDSLAALQAEIQKNAAQTIEYFEKK